MHDTRTRRRTRWGAGAVLCGVVAALLGAVPAGGAAAEARRADPPGTTYLYAGSFTARIDHRLFVDWGDGDSEEQTADVVLQGTLPQIKMEEDLDLVDLDILNDRVRVVSVEAESTTRSNSGQHVQTCTSTAGSTTGGPALWPDAQWQYNDFLPFAHVELTGTCADSEGPPTRFSSSYEPLIAPVRGGPAGAPTLNLPFRVERGTAPLTGADECPGNVPGQTRCRYAIEGTLTLHLIKRIPPPAPKPPPPPAEPQGAKLAPGAKQVTAGVRCPGRCTVGVRVTTLKGGRKVAPVRRFTPKPGRVVRLKVAIPPAKRGLVKKAGGVRVRLSYRLASGVRYSQVRTARW